MNILYIVQQSIYNNRGKWLTSDSNIQMMRGILSQLIEKTDWNFYILIANIKDFEDIKDYKEIFDNKRVHFISHDFPINAFLLRQDFNSKEFDDIFKNKLPKIDIIWNNITEISRNIKTYLKYSLRQDIKIITCCYWLDLLEIGESKVDKDVSYQWRQFDGFECADLVMFTCQSTKKGWIENSKKIFNKKFINRILEKSTVWDFGYSVNELDEYATEKKFDKKTILFLNRLSETNYTHHNDFINAINRLSKIRNDFQVVFTNPSMKISFKDLKSNVKNLYMYSDKSLNRKQYIELLWRADISIHLYTKERYGGCANVEAIHCDNIAIMPNVFEYKRRGGNSYQYFINKKIDINEIVDKLNKALDSSFINSKDHLEMKQRNLESSFELVSDGVIRDINKMIEDRNG